MRLEPMVERLCAGESVEVGNYNNSETLHVALIQQSDLDDLLGMLSDERVTEYLFFAPADESVYTGYFQPLIDSTHVAIAEQSLPGNVVLIARDGQGQFVGMAGLTEVMFLEGNFELGFQLPHASWGNGIATILSTLLLRIAFGSLKAHKVTADCYGGNVGSSKVLQKIGLAPEGTQKAYYRLSDGFDDRLHFGITRAEWLSRE